MIFYGRSRWQIAASICSVGILLSGCGPSAQSPPTSTNASDAASPVGQSGSPSGNAATKADDSQPGNVIDQIRAMAANPDNPYPVPSADNLQGQIEFMRRMATESPAGQTAEEMGQSIAYMMASRLVVAESLSKLTDVDAAVRQESQQSRIDSLRALAVVGPAGSEDLFRRECQTLIDTENEQSNFARQALLLFDIDLLAGNETQEIEPIVERVADLLPRVTQLSDDAFTAVGQAAIVLEQLGHSSSSVEVMKRLGDSVGQGKVAEGIEERYAQLEQMLPLVGLQRMARELERTNTPANAELVRKAVFEILQNPLQRNKEALSAVASATQSVEFLGNVTEAKAIYDQIGQSFSRVKDEKLASSAAETVKFAQRRLGLLGQSLSIDGALLNGMPFEWQAYAGKVVLIDFWASWCGPCLKEIPNIRKNYDRFHDQGFEVVGVNLDESLQDVDAYLQQKPLPWKTVVGGDPSAMGFGNPNAVRCGVEAIPFLVLVGKDGKVAGIHVRGERLAEEIQKQLKMPAAGQSG
ncbi:MAG: thioredoxin-like domain-containing protein [Planctomycetota bacterium]|nr:thioredoxin-like domain-containing protein [Planctomycetota bacterium]